MTLIVTAEPVPLKTDGVVRVGKTRVTLDFEAYIANQLAFELG